MPRCRYSHLVVAVLAAGVLAACSPNRVPPSTPAPVPGYTRVSASTDDAWDAVVDFLVDNGTAFDFISAEMRVAKITVLLAPGPLPGDRAGFSANSAAQELADCGRSGGVPLAGWGNLVAEVAVRVRPADSGALLKVVIPRVRQVMPNEVEYSCVSKGVFERRAETAITERLSPIMRGSDSEAARWP